MLCGESLVSFLHKYDVIKIGPEQKGNILHVVQLIMRSTLSVCDIRPDTSSKFPALLPFLSLDPHTIKVSLLAFTAVHTNTAKYEC